MIPLSLLICKIYSTTNNKYFYIYHIYFCLCKFTIKMCLTEKYVNDFIIIFHINEDETNNYDFLYYVIILLNLINRLE